MKDNMILTFTFIIFLWRRNIFKISCSPAKWVEPIAAANHLKAMHSAKLFCFASENRRSDLVSPDCGHFSANTLANLLGKGYNAGEALV